MSPVAVLIIWQVLSGTGLVSNQKLPPLNVIWRAAIGFVIGAALATVLGVFAGLLRWGDVVVDPLLQMIRNVPLFGLIPLFILWFGIGELPKEVLIAPATALPIYVNVHAGIREADPRLVEATTVLGHRRRQRLRQVVLPSAVPLALVGVRLGIASAWLSLVVAEQINADSGIGFMIDNARDFLRTDIVFVGPAVLPAVATPCVRTAGCRRPPPPPTRRGRASHSVGWAVPVRPARRTRSTSESTA
jgi:sulfonate transport system permease protein